MPGTSLNPGERLILSFKGYFLTPFARKVLEKGLCGGIILFSNNVENTRQLSALIEEIKTVASIKPPIIGIDQEGGRVQRITDEKFTLPSAREIGKNRTPLETKILAHSLGKALASIGINVNFAPVLDVLSEPGNTVIGDRAFGTEPEKVAEYGCAFARGLNEGGVLPVGKHFPGHGMTIEDSHLTLPRCRESMDKIMKTHAYPFAAAIREGIPGLMTAHVTFEDIDPDFPATFSEKILNELLRKKLRFDGVTFSDDLNMKAISAHFSLKEIAKLAAISSPDFLIHTGDEETQAALIEEMLDIYSRTSTNRLEAAHGRIEKFRSLIRN